MIGKTEDGIYYFSVRIKDKNGKIVQRKHQNSAWKTKKEVKAAMDLYLLKAPESDTSKITIDQLFSFYVEDVANKTKLRSITTHRNRYNRHIKPDLGNKIAAKLTKRDIMKWQNSLLSHNYSTNYLTAIQQFLKTLLNYGVEYEYILMNPFRSTFVKNNNVNKIEMTIWSTNDFSRFISKVERIEFKAFFTLLYWCGLRKGEAMALTAKDINFDTSTITVNKTYDHINKVTTTPKTTNSIRSVYMTADVRNVMKELIDRNYRIGYYEENDVVFGYPDHISSSTLKREQETACIASGVKIMRIHDFRHSHASLLVEMGFTPVEIADRLGHTVDMVNNVYSHLFMGSQQRMADKLEEASRKSQIEFSKTLGKC